MAIKVSFVAAELQFWATEVKCRFGQVFRYFCQQYGELDITFLISNLFRRFYSCIAYYWKC
jgi:hypothetical protein